MKDLLTEWKEEFNMLCDVEFIYNGKYGSICPLDGKLEVLVDGKEYTLETFEELDNLKVNETTLGDILRDEKSDMFVF